MAKVTVTTTGKLRSAKPRLVNGLDRGLILAAKLVAQNATDRAPIDTRRLKRSITHGVPFSTESGRAILVGTNVEYAAIQEFGGTTKPHEIRPRTAKALSFKMGGKTVFFKKVNHPGSVIPAQPYLRPALKANAENTKTIILKSIVGALTA